jgi:predicted DNA-binding ribbon-helix-helix protein
MTSDAGDGGDGARTESRRLDLEDRTVTLRLESAMWQGLDDAAEREGLTTAAVVGMVDRARGRQALPAALRVFAVAYFRRRAIGTNRGPGPSAALTQGLSAVAEGGR